MGGSGGVLPVPDFIKRQICFFALAANFLQLWPQVLSYVGNLSRVILIKVESGSCFFLAADRILSLSL